MLTIDWLIIESNGFAAQRKWLVSLIKSMHEFQQINWKSHVAWSETYFHKKELISHSCLSLNFLVGNKFVESCSKFIVGIPQWSNMKQIAKNPNFYVNFILLISILKASVTWIEISHIFYNMEKSINHSCNPLDLVQIHQECKQIFIL